MLLHAEGVGLYDGVLYGVGLLERLQVLRRHYGGTHGLRRRRRRRRRGGVRLPRLLVLGVRLAPHLRQYLFHS